MKLLIPLSYLNEACFLSLNVDEKKYKMVLKLAQDQLKTLLGPEFYEEIETQYDPVSDTFTSANDTLYEDYIKDFLAWETYKNYLAFAQSDSTPSGVRQFREEHSDILSDVKLSALEHNVAEKANYYANQMINFLRLAQSRDSTAYSLWTDCVKREMSWGISGVAASNDKSFTVYQAVNNNQP